MKFIPHEYQRYAIEYIKTHPVAAVFLDMGLGKTSITLTAIHDLLFDSFEVRCVLVVAPLRVARETWSAEIEKWEHLQDLVYSVAVGSEPERKAALLRQADIYIINRENVQWLIEDSGVPFDFDMVVIDELSSFKNHGTKRFKALLKVRPKVKRIVGLTGTPASNGLMDLWAEFRILDMGKRLGRFIGQYRATYFQPDKRNGMVIYSYKPLPYAEDAIYDAISDITISMKANDHLRMPELVNSEYVVRLSDEEKQKYTELKKELVLSLGASEVTAANAASLSGKPILVAYWFKHDLARIAKRLRELHIPFRQLDSTDSIRSWNSGAIPVALIHPASAGHGLNLQSGGSTLVWFGLTWSLELYQQTVARLWRQGQTSATVVVQHIITKDTMDERIMNALRTKDKTQSALIEAVKADLKS